MKIIFAGTPEVAVPTFEALMASEHTVVAVLTRSAKPKGRSKTLVPSEVAVAAQAHGVPIIEADSLRSAQAQAQLETLEADLGVVVAYGAIIPQEILDLLPHGWINLHFSKLPRWRGAAPVQRAIAAGDKETAINIFQLEAGLDTGPVYFSRTVEIPAEINSGDFLTQLSQIGAPDVVEVVSQIAAGTAVTTAQTEEGATYAKMIKAADLWVDFTKSASEVHNQVRACAPTPGAFAFLPDGKKLKILATKVSAPPAHTPGIGTASQAGESLAAGEILVTKKQVWVGTGAGSVELLLVAPPGKNMMEAAAWARGARLEPKTILNESGQMA
ncbi:methionyl-tRNA formyltransferase [Gleimia sp. 6138-11-ORH1]|uniref:methionyl-tRNA formyltransferase n=1 Tax=Gleimia sp. 6138-11-ORH1 TaxID=2973937 RepID=UPI002167FD01|nr:methionyl-tRNA formyltransferase [Gleimia sp. 6138-11-ORH1]MCS4484360.1 methionyl-tRNA formyltransferase [Gleimia sp. 6138-11-ORH1]